MKRIEKINNLIQDIRGFQGFNRSKLLSERMKDNIREICINDYTFQLSSFF
jgi:hypothetical protein